MALTDGIIGCWSPSLGASGYTLLDRSGRGNHGVLTNMDSTDWTGTSAGLGLDLDGSNDHIPCGTRLNAAMVNNLTVSAWGCFRARSASGNIASNINSTGNGGFALNVGFTANKVSWLQDGGTFDITSTATITDALWHHVVLSRYGTTGAWVLSVYIDGVGNTATVAVNPPAATGSGNLTMGRGGDYVQAGYLNMILGEVAIYNRALTAGEILDLYRRGNGAIGRELTGQTRRRTYGFVPAGFRPYWAARRTQVIGGGVR
jgi:hypothetical protein